MTGSRLNWNSRQSPTDMDETAPTKPSYEFDLRRNATPGSPSWPAKVQGETFGPTFIGKSWRAGLVVVAEIEGLPHPVAATETKWSNGVLVVKVNGNWLVPERIWTRTTVRGLDSTGLLIEKE